MEPTKDLASQTPKPEAQSPEPRDRVQIFIVNDEEAKSCDFWIGLFAKGPHSPNHLFYKGSLMEIFDAASKEGLCEGAPVMLSDTTEHKPKFIYLLPQLGEDAPEDDEWVKNILQAVNAYLPKTVGFYLSPAAMQDQTQSEASLRRVLEQLLAKTSIKTVALFPGDYGANAVLNVALAVKNNSLREVVVYH